MMTKISLNIPDNVYSELCGHLLPEKQVTEEAAFMFVRQENTDFGVEFRFVELIKATDRDYAQKLGDYLELSDEMRARIIKRAHDLGASIVEFHSHLGPWPAAFSESDRIGLEEFVPHVWWRLKHKPYLAVVMAQSGFDGLVWLAGPTAPQPLDIIKAGEKSYTPTNLTLPRWHASNARFDRTVLAFGREGQERLSKARVVIVGIGGLGTHVVQQLAFLGVGYIVVIDNEELDITNGNRYVIARHGDAGKSKVELAVRAIQGIDPTIRIDAIHNQLRSEEAFDAIKASDYVFGCLDNEGGRYILNELCAAYEIPYFDLASEITGGRVCSSWDGNGCIACFEAFDIEEAQAELAGNAARQNRDAIYGVNRISLDSRGPSVVSVNGVVASLAVTEFLFFATDTRKPHRLINYYTPMAMVTRVKDPPKPDCYFCKSIRGLMEKAEVERYIRSKILV